MYILLQCLEIRHDLLLMDESHGEDWNVKQCLMSYVMLVLKAKHGKFLGSLLKWFMLPTRVSNLYSWSLTRAPF